MLKFTYIFKIKIMTKVLNNSKNKRMIALIAFVLFLAIISLLILHKTNTINLFNLSRENERQITEDDKNAKTTSSTPTAQEDYSDGDEREPGNSLNENRGSSNISDLNGQIPQGTSTSSSTSSATGEITVYTPANNSQIETGQTIAGTSTLSKVAYRVIDDVSGMIAMGELSVVNGKFSGRINFDTSSSSGRIDIFATKPDGSEYSPIEILVRFR